MFLERFACHYKILQPSEESISLNIVVTQTMTIFQLLPVKDKKPSEESNSSNIIVIQTTAIFHLFPIKNKTLLVWRDSFYALNFSFHHLNGVCRFYFLSGRLFTQCSYKDLHATTNS